MNKLNSSEKQATILRDFPLLVEALGECAAPETGIVLVKANVCNLLEAKLRQAGFNVLNRGTVIPFPSSGQQNNFRSAIRKVLGRVHSTKNPPAPNPPGKTPDLRRWWSNKKKIVG